MFERIIRNLLSNAIRYTNNGGVLLACRRRGENMQIEIYDTGIGIPANKIDRIFEEFYQIENPERDRRKGLGLGLAIVSRLCHLLGHAIEVNSIPNRGTVFRITVPFISSHTESVMAEQIYTADLCNASVVVIDDEAMIRKGMLDILQEWGCQVVAAESSAQALQLLTDKNICPDIILSDYQLRENISGIETVNLIRTALNKPIPAIIITGDSNPERLREAKAQGLHLLHKPVSSARLRSLMSYLLDKQ